MLICYGLSRLLRVLVLSEGLARSLRQSTGAGVQREGRDSDAGDDVSEV